MTAVEALRKPKARRLTDNFAPQSRVEADEPETSLDRYRRWCREADEREKRDGTFDVEPPTMEEIVAIVKEVRAERYAKKQKDSAGH